MISTSLKTLGEANSMPPKWIPTNISLEAYVSVIKDEMMLIFFKNSIIVCSAVAVINIILSALSGYAFSRFRFKGRVFLLMAILGTQMFPLVLLLLALYFFFLKLHLLDTYLCLVLSFITVSLPFAIWMMKNFFDSIPIELEEAAMVDGCSRLNVLFRISFPLVAPGALVAGLFSFLNAWNNLLYSLTLTSSSEMRPLAPGLVLRYVQEAYVLWPEMMAASILATTPLIIIFIILQRYMIQGLTAGAVKG
jgi:multiple sugar transport system permease protein